MPDTSTAPNPVPAKAKVMPHTTEKQLEEFNDCINKHFLRIKKSSGQGEVEKMPDGAKKFYKPATIYPQYTSSTGDDLVDINDVDGKKVGEGYQYIARFVVHECVERRSQGEKNKNQEEILDTFTCPCVEFLEKFTED